jgi:uncharacterized membrane protein
MYGIYVYDEFGQITLTLTNVLSWEYDFYLYGHGNQNTQNSLFQMSVDSISYGSQATTTNSGWLSPVWEEGMQYIEFSDVIISVGQTVTISVQQGVGNYAVLSGLQIVRFGSSYSSPSFVTQPASQSVTPGAAATFSVAANGAQPLTYQWLFNNVVVLGETNSSYTVTNAQLGTAGNYSVIVANEFGSITSSSAGLNVIVPQTTFIDVAFTGVSVTGKTGFAGTGTTSNDFWNTYDVRNTADLPYLKYVDGAPSAAEVITPNFYSAASNGSPDAMYGIYAYSSKPMTFTITNLYPGVYNFYLLIRQQHRLHFSPQKRTALIILG